MNLLLHAIFKFCTTKRLFENIGIQRTLQPMTHAGSLLKMHICAWQTIT